MYNVLTYVLKKNFFRAMDVPVLLVLIRTRYAKILTVESMLPKCLEMYLRNISNIAKNPCSFVMIRAMKAREAVGTKIGFSGRSYLRLFFKDNIKLTTAHRLYLSLIHI